MSGKCETDPCAASARRVLDTCFLEVRAQLLSIAATLDRVDRMATAAEVAEIQADSRMKFIRHSLEILGQPEAHKAKRILELYSLS